MPQWTSTLLGGFSGQAALRMEECDVIQNLDLAVISPLLGNVTEISIPGDDVHAVVVH
jgi:hypothetical protein